MLEIAVVLSGILLSGISLGQTSQYLSSSKWQVTYPIDLRKHSGLKESHKSVAQGGAVVAESILSKHWHDRTIISLKQQVDITKAWDVDCFFTSKKEAMLCRAVNRRDVTEMERLIAQGADVNFIGKEGMTLLYWSFFITDDPRPFHCLLKHGANPNVICRLDRDRWLSNTYANEAVVHLVSLGVYNRLFKEVFQSGGDPNLPCENEFEYKKNSPLFLINPLTPDCAERLEVLLAAGADLKQKNKQNNLGFCYRMLVSRNEIGYKTALLAYKNGADTDELLPYKKQKMKAFDILTSPGFENDPESMAEESYYHQLMEYLDSRY